MAITEELDVCVVGAGFSGCFILDQARKAGFKTLCIERTDGIGGTWKENQYPGARVDSHFPVYQYSDPDLWEDFTWTERFPGYEEIQRYFAHVDKKWQLSKDIRFNSNVVGAHFDTSTNKWNIKCENGQIFRAQWFIATVGFAAKPYTPSFPGLDKFISNQMKQVIHSNKWPRGPNKSIDLKGKRVGVIGTGATGVQIIQEIGPTVEHLTVYQRTPAQTLPMRQRNLSKAEQDQDKLTGTYAHKLAIRLETRGGFDMSRPDQATFEVDAKEREALWEKLWQVGGFAFALCNYTDIGLDKTANNTAYDFYAMKNRARITNPKHRDLLVPLKPAYPLFTKRPPLEQRYLEVFNQENCDLIDVSETGSPIIEVTDTGITTKEGHVELDVLILATGFDAVTGSMTQMNIKGTDGRTLSEKWNDRASSCMGISVHNYPNMFFTYGLQAPTAFANGPTAVEVQGQWIMNVLTDCREAGIVRFEVTELAEKTWVEHVSDVWNATLFPGTRSWYQGNNIPGKNVEPLNYLGGIPAYISALTSSRVHGYKEFNLTRLKDDTVLAKL